jgi:hypothetical protein
MDSGNSYLGVKRFRELVDKNKSPGQMQASTVCRLSRADFRQPAMCLKTESCLQVILPWSIVWLQWIRTWKSVCFTVFPQKWQLTEAHFPSLLRLMKVGSVLMLAFRAKFRTPRGRFHMYDFQAMPSVSACNRAKRFPCMVYNLKYQVILFKYKKSTIFWKFEYFWEIVTWMYNVLR